MDRPMTPSEEVNRAKQQVATDEKDVADAQGRVDKERQIQGQAEQSLAGENTRLALSEQLLEETRELVLLVRARLEESPRVLEELEKTLADSRKKLGDSEMSLMDAELRRENVAAMEALSRDGKRRSPKKV